MATARQGVKIDIDEHVTCTVCMEVYKNPRVLPCLHSYCKKCIKQLIERTSTRGKTFRCPTCRETTDVPEKGADGFPHNFFIQDLCDKVTQT